MHEGITMQELREDTETYTNALTDITKLIVAFANLGTLLLTSSGSQASKMFLNKEYAEN